TVFNRARGALVERPLCENRRSLPAIIDFVNAVSAHSMAPGEDAVAKPYRVMWSEKHRLRAIRPAAGAPAVELLVAPAERDGGGAKLDTRALRRVEADAIARRCAQIVRETRGGPHGVGFRQIALLLRSFTDVAIYEDAFQRAGVPSYTVKG